jgi:formimidoylglutamate deiminase
MATNILIPEFFIDFDGRIHTGGIAISQGKIIDAGDHVLNSPGTKVRFADQVLMPGFVNCHSHAFQRLLRGLVERKPKTPRKNNFFTWREKMYALAGNITRDSLNIIAQFAYLEMIEAGFTHVAEFHYLHHEMTSGQIDDPLALSRAMSTAAEDQKINLTLLECAYQRNNFNEALKPEQRRFAFKTVREYLAFLEEAHASIKNPFTRIGAAIHSVRAVDEEWFRPISDRADMYGMPLHIHVSEQRAEVDACVMARGMSPIALLHRHRALTPSTTLIHATHLISGDLELIADSGATICLCPSTEKNLGDGILPLLPLKSRGVPFTIGTDQHVRLDPFDELRCLEEQERLRVMQRLILNQEGEYLYETLLPCLTTHGMRSLERGFKGGSLIGLNANLVGIALPPEYQWHGPKAALDALFVSGNSKAVRTVFTNGHRVVDDGRSLFRDKEYLIKEIGKFFREINLA